MQVLILISLSVSVVLASVLERPVYLEFSVSPEASVSSEFVASLE